MPDSLPQRTLSPELLSLIQHVELSKTGWHQRGLGRLVLGTLWLSGHPMTSTDILSSLKSDFGITLAPADLAPILGDLRKRDLVLELPNGSIKLADACIKSLASDLEATEAAERDARARFSELLECHSLDDSVLSWSLFVSDLLVPLIRTVGAATYNLLTGEAPDYGAPILRKFLGRHQADIQSRIRVVISKFLDSKELAARNYVLRILNAHFFLASGNLPRTTLEAITAKAQTKLNFNFVLDTNTLFSLLDLHDNPSNDAVRALVDLLSAITPNVSVKYYVLPTTLEEARGVLLGARDHARELDIGPRVARAAIGVHHLSSVLSRFLQRAEVSQKRLDADSYFAPYVANLLQVLRDRQIELLNVDLEPIHRRQDVIDDISRRKAALERRKLPHTYAQIRHDVILLHCVADRRPSTAETSFLSAGWWAVTVDFSLLYFDAAKAQRQRSLALCIHPANLVQMLGFWVPRSASYENAAFEALRMPFLFEPFDAHSEKVTVRILRVLSRYQNVDDLPEPTITKILLDESLRARIDKLPDEVDPTAELRLVDEAIVQAHEATTAQLRETEAQLSRKEAVADAASREVLELRAELVKAQKDSELRVSEVESAMTARLKALEDDRRIANERAAVLERNLATAEAQGLQRRYLIRRAWLPPLLGAAVASVLAYAAAAYVRWWDFGWSVAAIAVIALSSLTISVLPEPSARDLRHWSVRKRLKRRIVWLWTVCMLGIMLNIVADQYSERLAEVMSRRP